MKKLPRFVTVDEAAKILQCHRNTVFKLIKQGKLPILGTEPVGGGRGRLVRIPLTALEMKLES